MATHIPAHITIILSLLLLRLLTLTSATQHDLIVATAIGRVRGVRLSVPGSGSILAFLGIPYGKPPVGKLRFRSPEPVEEWAGVKDATRFPNSCCQPLDTAFPGFQGAEMWNANTQMSEDCLYLNVWTPCPTHPQSSTLAPVMVWIYGGGFTSGTSSLNIYDGRFLSQSEDVVVVSMNYRLGALGFLALPGAPRVHGNSGILDQQLALRWVMENIEAFGGDPSKVTLFGESAGAGSVGVHLLSPGSQGLFHRAILQSGSPNAPWVSLSQAEAWNRSWSLGKALGCPLSSLADLEPCLQEAPVDDILLHQFHVLSGPSLIGLPFHPVVDGHFLPEHPEVLLQSGNFKKTDVLVGLNKDEGTYFLLQGAPGFDITGQSLISKDNFLEGLKLALPQFNDVLREKVASRYLYWANESSSAKYRDALGSIVGDWFFNCPLLNFTHRYTEHGGKSHLYLFDHHSSANPWPAWMGVMHGYEIEFVLGIPLNSSLGYTYEEVALSKELMKRWANFARTGHPMITDGDWPMFTLEQQEYIRLDSGPPLLQRKMFAERCQFWNFLVPIMNDLRSCSCGRQHVNRCVLLALGLLMFIFELLQ
ncbi:acetylcholinesterase [Osmerus mordax]|uniref:acetylcholinesterase n=1 Tax=Osmerus mordax TaxID=8014 RepID=UPI00350F1D46